MHIRHVLWLISAAFTTVYLCVFYAQRKETEPARIESDLATKELLVGELPQIVIRVKAPSDRSLFVVNPQYTALEGIFSFPLQGQEGTVWPQKPPSVFRHITPDMELYRELKRGDTITYSFSAWGVPIKPGKYTINVACVVDRDKKLKHESVLSFECKDPEPQSIGSSVSMRRVDRHFEVLNVKMADAFQIICRRWATGRITTTKVADSNHETNLIGISQSPAREGQEFTLFFEVSYEEGGVSYSWILSEHGDILEWRKHK